MKRICFAGVLLLMLISCSRSEPEMIKKENPYESEYVGRFHCGGPEIDYDRAWDIAMEAPVLFSDDLTKAAEKGIEGWTPLTSSEVLTKDGTVSLDTLMYVFNYEGGQGYVVIPTDDLDGEVVAYVEEGSFNLADTSTNELQKFLVDLMIDYRRAARMPEGMKGPVGDSQPKEVLYLDFAGAKGPKCQQVQREQPRDGDYGTPVAPPPYVGEGNIEYYKTKGCYLPGYYKRTNNLTCPRLLTTCWGQGEPFYNMTPIKGDRHCLTGCVATAIVQIMAYHSYPTEYIMDGKLAYTHLQDMRKNKYWYDFDNSAQAKSIISKFFLHIGNLLGNDWGTDGTEADDKDALRVLKDFRFGTPSKVEDYDIFKIIKSINEHKPVYFGAFGYHTNTGKKSGHAWVIDGYKRFQDETENVICYFDEYARLNRKTITGSDFNTRYYFHCNFGWNGTANGYYNTSIYDTRSPQEATGPPRDEDPLVYNKKFVMISNITKP